MGPIYNPEYKIRFWNPIVQAAVVRGDKASSRSVLFVDALIAIISSSKGHRIVNSDGVDQQRSASANAMLPRIACAFGVTEEVFVRATTTSKDLPAFLNAVIQTSALLNAFERITDPIIRAHCLDYVRTIARRETKSAA